MSSTGQGEEAITLYRKILQKEPNQSLAQVALTVTLMKVGKEDEARAEAAKVLRIDPKFSVISYTKVLPFRDQSEKDKYINTLRKAGLK